MRSKYNQYVLKNKNLRVKKLKTAKLFSESRSVNIPRFINHRFTYHCTYASELSFDHETAEAFEPCSSLMLHKSTLTDCFDLGESLCSCARRSSAIYSCNNRKKKITQGQDEKLVGTQMQRVSSQWTRNQDQLTPAACINDEKQTKSTRICSTYIYGRRFRGMKPWQVQFWQNFFFLLQSDFITYTAAQEISGEAPHCSHGS